jgi:hypothetical protein
MVKYGVRFVCVCLLAGALLPASPARAQGGARGPAPAPAPATPPSQAPPPTDTLGRDTPRGTVLGFMRAARDGRDDVAPLYLNTNLRGRAADAPSRAGDQRNSVAQCHSHPHFTKLEFLSIA